MILKVKDIKEFILDKIIIYKGKNDEFENIYKGDISNISSDVLEMRIRSIGAAKKGVVDIQVF